MPRREGVELQAHTIHVLVKSVKALREPAGMNLPRREPVREAAEDD